MAKARDDQDASKDRIKRLIYDESLRAKAIQLFVVLVTFGAAYFLISNIVNNLRQMELPFGFGFVESTAGFDVAWSLIPYDPSMSYGRVYLVGIVNTIILSVLIILFSTLLGFVVGILRLSKNLLVAQVARWYVEFFRNVPLLIQVVFWFIVVFSTLPAPRQSFGLFDLFFLNNRGFYFPTPKFEEGFLWTLITMIVITVTLFVLRRKSRFHRRITGRGWRYFYPLAAVLLVVLALIFLLSGSPLGWGIPVLQGFNFEGGGFIPTAFVAAFTAMTIYRSASIGETVRAGIQSIHKGQLEASTAIGFPPIQTLRFIVIPQAARAILPPLINLWLTIVKESSLAVAIGFPELVSVFMQTSLNQTGRAIEIVMMVMGFYMCASLTISFLLNQYNKRIQMQEG
ncbi:MAG: ABC transporter permease subunit [Proteobacteria bacterium]|nr:ABC transporter permease subunit [Pseudomonadota bacterium]